MRLLLVAMAAIPAVSSPALSQIAQPVTPIGDIGGFSGDPDALPRVITEVANASGGDVIAARYALRNGAGGFDVVISKDGRLDFVRLEDSGRQIRRIDMGSRPTWMLNWVQRANLRIVRDAKVPLEAAVRIAEQSEGKPAVAAGIARGVANYMTDVHAYNVLILLSRYRTERVAVDSANGQVIEDPGALSDWP